jgi:hypothetical protein
MSDNSSIHIGSMVVCIRDDFGDSYAPERTPYKGEILTVREIIESQMPIDPKPLFVRFKEIINPECDYDAGFGGVAGLYEQAFDITWFRPCRKTDISAFNKHLMPLKDHVVP